MKKERKELSASTSIYFSLVTLLVLSLLFTLLEGARIEGLKANVRMNSELVAESVLAGYVSPLWENYHIFAGNGMGDDGQWSAGSILISADTIAKENLSREKGTQRGLWLYPMQAEGVSLGEYHLLTDDKGEAFCRLAAEYMKNHMAAAGVEAVKEKLQEMQGAKNKAGNMDEKVENANSCMQKAKEEAEAAEKEQGAASVPTVSDTAKIENPLEYRKAWKASDFFTLLGVKPTVLSEKKTDIAQNLERRKKQTGNWTKGKVTASWEEHILFQEYLLQQFSCYPAGGEQEEKSERVLDYEVEYLLAGKASDRQNLKAVLKKLLALREVANFVYLQTDEQKKSEAMTLATLLVGATGNALLVKGVQQGIFAVWAYAESVSDVKSLLDGEEIPILKTAKQWTTDVGGLSKKTGFKKAEKCESGLTYRDYLRLLLAAENRGKVCYRAMDLMEWELRAMQGYETLRMDMLWDKCSLTCEYEAKPLFVSAVRQEYHWSVQKVAEYLTE